MPTLSVPTLATRLPGARWILLVIPLALLLIIPSAQRVGAQDKTDFQPTWYMVVDWANLLDEGQEQSAINDAWRLNMLGVPTQVVTEFAQSTPELAKQRADQLRTDHGIESQPGADDGIVIYAAVTPNNRTQVTVAISAGPNALPHGGFTNADLEQIASEIVLPQLAAGHPPRAIVYSLREMIYRDIFTAPPSAPLAGGRETLNSVLPWAAPIVAIATTVVAVRGVGQVKSFTQAALRVAAPLAMALILGVLAVAGESGVAAFAAIGLVVVAVAVAMLADRALRGQDTRTLQADLTSPGSLANPGGQA